MKSKGKVLIGCLLLAVLLTVVIAYAASTNDAEKNVDKKTSESSEKNSESDSYTLVPGTYRIEGYDNNFATGATKAHSFSIDAYGNMSAFWSYFSSHMILGWYTIEDDILVLHDGDNGDEYKFRITGDNTVSVILQESSTICAYGEDYVVQDGDVFTYAEECGAIITQNGEPASYRDTHNCEAE